MERRMVAEIGVSDLEHAFDVAEENLENDLSVIRVSMIRDVHDESIKLYVTVFGKDSEEGDAPVAEFWVEPAVIGTEEEFNNGGVEASRLRAIFSEGTFHLILGLNVPIQWLCDDGCLITVSLFPGEDNGVRLLPVDQ